MARGTLTVIHGCMFSGKTTELIRRLAASPRHRTLAVKHAIDTRFCAVQIVSHAGQAVPAQAVSASRDIVALVRHDTSLVAIDEGHFFDVGLTEAAEVLRARGVEVVVAALQPDSWGRPFPLVDHLLSRADQRVPRTATCARCGAAADRTQRLTPIINGQMVVDPTHYEPRCRHCWRPPPEPHP